MVTREEAENFVREYETLYIEVSAKQGDNINNLFQSIAAILPGNENNRAFATDQSKTEHNIYVFMLFIALPMTTSAPIHSPNINLTNRGQTDEEFNTKKKNCAC